MAEVVGAGEILATLVALLVGVPIVLKDGLFARPRQSGVGSACAARLAGVGDWSRPVNCTGGDALVHRENDTQVRTSVAPCLSRSFRSCT